MAVIPTGVPAWLRMNDFAAYGGDLNKRNFASRGAINPKTDVSAEAFSRITGDLAALARTAPFAVMQIKLDDATPAAPTVEYCCLMTGIRVISYLGSSAPAGFPSVARNGNGDCTITLASSYTDPYGVVGTTTIRQVTAQLNGVTAGTATAEIVTATTTRIRAFVAAGTAYSSPRVTVTIGLGT